MSTTGLTPNDDEAGLGRLAGEDSIRLRQLAARLAEETAGMPDAFEAGNARSHERIAGIAALCGGAAPDDGATVVERRLVTEEPAEIGFDHVNVPAFSGRNTTPHAAGSEPSVTEGADRQALTPQCLALLRAGRIEEFNQLRPAGRIDFRRQDLSHLDLSGADLRHVDLTRAVLSGSVLTDAQLQHAVLVRAALDETTLTRARFYQANMRFADLTGYAMPRRPSFRRPTCAARSWIAAVSTAPVFRTPL